jgi:hypothetical protein
LLLTIALGVGSNASVYGFVRGLVTPDLPVAGIDTVVSVFTRDAHGTLAAVSFETYLSLRTGVDVFESLGAARESRVPIAVDGRTSTMTVAAITTELADLLQLRWPAASSSAIVCGGTTSATGQSATSGFASMALKCA